MVMIVIVMIDNGYGSVDNHNVDNGDGGDDDDNDDNCDHGND